MINNYFFEAFENIPRQGPGTKEETEKALNSIIDLPKNPCVLDIGCGKGQQSLHLAENINGHILALDKRKSFLEFLQKQINTLHLGSKVSCLIGDMGELPFIEEQFDLIWSEGSAFIIGFERALKEWNKYIKPGGHLAFSDCVWLKDNPPKELKDYWLKEEVSLPTIKEVLLKADQENYTTLNHFTLSNTAWKKEFYDHLDSCVQLLKVKYKDNREAQETFSDLLNEIELFDKYHEYYGYEFFILQK